jgi:hypothetical protein
MNIGIISLTAIALFMSLALITAFSIAIPAALASSSGGAVPLVPVKTGNSKLDKDINKFYSCIKKQVILAVTSQSHLEMKLTIAI